MKPIHLSVVIIAKNAGDLLKDCIESVEFADEIIVVDGGSVDNTKDIAKSLGAKVIEGNANDFSEQRNIGLQAAKGKWILYVDTDERVSSMLRKNIQFQISNIQYQMSAFKVKRQNFYLGNHLWPSIETLERLFLKEKLKGWFGKLHETPQVDGSVGILDGYLLHYTHRNLESMVSKTIEWSKVEAKLRYDTYHPKIVVWRLIRVMATGFWDSYIQQGGWKAGTMGFIESLYQAYSMFVTYATLWEMQKQNKTYS